MNYEINVSLNGKHFFATSERSIQDQDTLNKVYKVLQEKFPASEGYELNVTMWQKVGQSVNMD